MSERIRERLLELSRFKIITRLGLALGKRLLAHAKELGVLYRKEDHDSGV